MDTIDYGYTIEEIARLIETNELKQAALLAEKMPSRIKKTKIVNAKYAKNSGGNKLDARKYTFKDLSKLYFRDGFIDRYNGLRLVAPPALRAISIIIPDSFPFIRTGQRESVMIVTGIFQLRLIMCGQWL